VPRQTVHAIRQRGDDQPRGRVREQSTHS
jgi:hypothetical protein